MFIQPRPATFAAWGADPSLQAFPIRVIITADEFERLQMGEHEDEAEIPPAFAWCIARLGKGGDNWMLQMPCDGDAAVYFSSAKDALAFVLAFDDDRLLAAA